MNPKLTPKVRTVLGAAIWIVLVAGATAAIRRYDPGLVLTKRLSAHVAGAPPRFDAEFPAGSPVVAGSVIRVAEADGHYAAGRVLSVAGDGGARRAVLEIYPGFAGRLTADSRLHAMRTSGEIAWVLKTLFPPERLERIRERLEARWRLDRDRLFAELEPGLAAFIDELVHVLRDDFARVTRERRAEVAAIGEVLRERAWSDNFEDVFRQEVWPRVEERSQPLLKDIGDEIVSEFPLWATSWAYVVQTLPFTDNDRVAERLREFIKDKALPIVRRHGDDFRAMASGVLRDTLRSERALESLESAADDVAGDPRFKAASRAILESWIVDSPRFRELLAGIWSRPGIREPMRRFLDRADSDVRAIANMILLNDDRDGINPDLARVLRRKLLREDESWVLLEPEGGGAKDGAAGRLVGLGGGAR